MVVKLESWRKRDSAKSVVYVVAREKSRIIAHKIFKKGESLKDYQATYKRFGTFTKGLRREVNKLANVDEIKYQVDMQLIRKGKLNKFTSKTKLKPLKGKYMFEVSGDVLIKDIYGKERVEKMYARSQFYGQPLAKDFNEMAKRAYQSFMCRIDANVNGTYNEDGGQRYVLSGRVKNIRTAVVKYKTRSGEVV